MGWFGISTSLPYQGMVWCGMGPNRGISHEVEMMYVFFGTMMTIMIHRNKVQGGIFYRLSLLLCPSFLTTQTLRLHLNCFAIPLCKPPLSVPATLCAFAFICSSYDLTVCPYKVRCSDNSRRTSCRKTGAMKSLRACMEAGVFRAL